MIRIRHAGITVQDRARSIAFYRALGFELLFEIERKEKFIGTITGYPGAHLKIAMLRLGEATIELLEYVHPNYVWAHPGATVKMLADTYYPGNVHICLEGDPKATLLGNLTEFAGFIGAAIIPDGPQKDAHVSYWRGPDGETIELFDPPPKSKMDETIDAIEGVRARSNKLWMGLVRLSMEKFPAEARAIFDQIEANDALILGLSAHMRKQHS